MVPRPLVTVSGAPGHAGVTLAIGRIIPRPVSRNNREGRVRMRVARPWLARVQQERPLKG